MWVAIVGVCVAIGWTDVRRARARDPRETGDLQHFYYAADAVRHGRDPYAAWTRGYIYPPFIAFVAQPIAALSYNRAAGAMLAANVAATLLALTLAAQEFLSRFGPNRDLRQAEGPDSGAIQDKTVPRHALIPAVVLLGLLLDVDKVKGEWQMWQTDVWMLLLFVLGLRWLDRRPLWAGVALGIGANIKYLPLLLLPYLLVRRRWAAAGSLAVASAAFAVMPAISTGWSANGRNWATALHGLTGMAGGPAGAERAEVHAITDSLSCSATSALARWAGPTAALPLAAGVAGLAFLAVAGLYRARGVSLFDRGGRATVGVEWPVLVAALLAFSPQTNTRHLFDALLVTTAGAALLLTPRPAGRRWVLAVGLAVLALGFTLPPGRRTVQGFKTPTTVWLRLGGPCWCLLVAAATLLWAGVQRRLPDEQGA